MAMVMVLALACGCSKEKTLKSPESETETGTKAGSVKQSTSKHKNQPTKDAKKRDESVMQKTNTEEAELVGEVIDAWCYCSKVMGDGRGKEHETRFAGCPLRVHATSGFFEFDVIDVCGDAGTDHGPL